MLPHAIQFTPETLASLLLALLWLALMRAVRRSGYGIALLSLAGTALHEACHWLAGLVLLARPVSVSLWPRRQGGHWVLGSVSFANLNILNAAFVAFAPLAMLPLGWLLFEWWMVPALHARSWLSWLFSSYLVACCAFACLPSTTDIKAGALSALLYCTIGYGLWRVFA